MNHDQLKADNAQYLWHPMAHPGAMKKSAPDIIAKGEGCWIWDVDGHKMLDGVGGLWACNLGHSNKPVRDAIVAQMDELPFYNVFRGTTHVRAIELSKRLVQMMQPEGVATVMFSNGGSDAVEGALKVARQYWKLKGQADRFKFISLRQGYHGVHFGGMSVNGNTNFRRAYEPLLPGCFHVDTPWLYHNPYTDDPIRLGEICAEMLEREIVFQGPDTVAAFIAEPVQGAGGVIVPPPNYWPLVRQICDKYGVLLIADEVVTGFGRSGELFGTRLWGVNADMWCLAKGISSGYIPWGPRPSTTASPTCLTPTPRARPRSRTATPTAPTRLQLRRRWPRSTRSRRWTFRATPPGWARHLQARLRKLVDTCSFVGDVRGVGLMLGIEMVSDKAKRTPMTRSSDIPARVAKAAYKAGLMVRISGPNLILSPPLVITREEVDFMCDVLEAAFAAVQEGRA
jgi:putrescine---pyruvate transaminase